MITRSLALAALLGTSALAATPAFAACDGAAAHALVVGTAEAVEPGGARSYAVELAGGQGIYVDLSTVAPEAASDSSSDDHDDAASKAAPGLGLCDARGAQMVPLPGEVFEKGGSVSDIPEGRRLRFVAPAAGRYRIAVPAAEAAREIIVRNRQLGAPGSAGVTATSLGRVESGNVSSHAQKVFSFSGTAGQWVELKSTSENDTLLRLAAPTGAGGYAQIAENDDSDGLNPVIRRRLPASGTYYLQVDSLGDESKEFTLTLKAVPAPPPPPPPAALRAGVPASGRLSGENDTRLYLLPVSAGHAYRLELTAPYDGVVSIGLPNPLEADDGDEAAAGFASIKQEDSNTSGTEKMTFTARSGGQLLVQVKSFGIGDSDGGYRLGVNDLGG